MMRTGNERHIVHDADLAQNMRRMVGMALHFTPFFGVEFGRFLKYRAANTKLANILENCGTAQAAAICGAEFKTFGNRIGIESDPLAMPLVKLLLV